ncbi:MAG: hypothetical protein MUC99_08135 [Anaerolineae bacterium]|nr:hypothetical protein [Anaerolineae bacterium]
MRAAWNVGWERFSLITKIIGEVNSKVLLTILYFTIFVPFGLISRLGSDPLDFKGKPAWVARKPVQNDLPSARLQG